jgi:MEMO1 family protein
LPACAFNNDAFVPEHAIEAELPFIQYYLPHVHYVPLVIGFLNEQNLQLLAKKLAVSCTPDTLFVVSSDMIHYGSRFHYTPFKDNVLLRIKQLDSELLLSLQLQSLYHFKRIEQQTQASVCGFYPLQLLLEVLKLQTHGPLRGSLVAYTTSNDTHYDATGQVSYAGVIFTRDSLQQPIPLHNLLNTYEKQSLLQYARQTLEQTYTPAKIRTHESLLRPLITPTLLQPYGIFVTLYHLNHGIQTLRGCIGTIKTDKPLYATINAMTLAAAFNDTRFKPLQPTELNSTVIEIAVLSQPEAITSWKNIKLGTDGIILINNGNEALFLPQVATEQRWNLEETLTALSEKAGLEPTAWKKPDTQFKTFRTLTFNDKQRATKNTSK